MEKPSFDCARFVPSRRSLKNFYKELKYLEKSRLSSEYRLICGNHIDISNLKSIKSNCFFTNENNYSKIDIVYFLMLLEKFIIENNIVKLNHIINVISSQQLNFKLRKYSSNIKFNNPAYKLLNLVISLHPKIPFSHLFQPKEE